MQSFWLKKAAHLGFDTQKEQEEAFFERGGIFSEFGKVLVIAMGYVTKSVNGDLTLKVTSMADENEKALLKRFKDFLTCFPAHVQLCGHNGKEFDFPYLARRMTLCNIPLPAPLDTAGKKPWEVNHLDTMELWKFGDRKNYTSLDLLAHLLGAPSSKEDMTGDEVNTYYYKHKDIASIRRYCAKDVITTAQVYRRLKFLPLIPIDAIHIVDAPSSEKK